MTGQALASSYSSATAFRDAVICNSSASRKGLLPTFINCSSLIVDVRTTGSMSSNGFSSADTSGSFYTGTPKYCVGAPGDIVVLRVVYPMPAFLSILTASSITAVSTTSYGETNYNGTRSNVLMITAVFRN